MIQTNSIKSVTYLKKGFKWAFYAALVGAVVGIFAGCMVEPRSTVYDDKGPCLDGRITINDGLVHFEADESIANRSLAAKDGYSISKCTRAATEVEKNDSVREHALIDLVFGAILGAMCGGAIPWLTASWFLLLVLISQLFGAVRGEPVRMSHRVTIKTNNSNKNGPV
jgi:hypothetical protein